jgi:mRNA interferase YafQ
MRELKYTSQFKKDVKRIQNNPKKMYLLNNALSILKTTGTLPKEYLPHPLKGKYKGYMECHIEGDFLLIWIDEASNLIKLVRVGSHSELFRS